MKVGVIGAGQLGRMLALAGYPLGLEFRFLDRAADASAGQLAPLIVGDFADESKLAALAREVDVVTFDWENVSVEALERAVATTPLRPPARALAVSQDRLLEKQLFRTLRIPTPDFAAVESRAELERAVKRIGAPGVLKTRRLGYDGKGQFVVRRAADLEAAWNALGGQPLLYEALVNFTREVSALGVRSASGEIRTYPLAENTHANGILRHTLAPSPHRALAREATAHLRRVLRHFDYVGLLTIEFFAAGGRLLANEIAPRVHNSGHWTIEGAVTSQFENHLRAILGWPLGSTEATGHAGMINFIGRLPERELLLAERGLYVHDYGKEARPGRKVGHCTFVEASAGKRDARLHRLLKRLR